MKEQILFGPIYHTLRYYKVTVSDSGERSVWRMYLDVSDPAEFEWEQCTHVEGRREDDWYAGWLLREWAVNA